MESKFEITQSRVVFEYSENASIRKKVFEFEECLKDYFKIPFRNYAVPDTFDPSIPRFESESLFGHSKIQVSPTVLNFTTIYDEKFKTNKEEIKKYLKERASVFSKVLANEDKKYVAFILDLAFEMKKDSLNAFIKKYSGANAVSEAIIDFSFTYSITFQKSFFININCSKYISEIVVLEGDKVRKTGEYAQGILVTIDLNTKHFYNMNGIFEEKLISDTADLLFDLISKNSVENYLNGGIK